MTESEPQFIVRMPDGRKSKPTTKDRIREMHLTGKISDDAKVVRVGTVYEIPVRAFLGLSDPGEESGAEVNQGELYRPSAASADSAFKPPAAEQYRHRKTESAGDVALSTFGTVLYWPVQGFLMPTKGVNQTRDYLRRTIVWIEVWLRIQHFFCLLAFFVMAWVAVRTLSIEFQRLQQNGQPEFLPMLRRIGFEVFTYLIFFWVLMLVQAVLRLIPAGLRYWIEATEERRIDYANSTKR